MNIFFLNIVGSLQSFCLSRPQNVSTINSIVVGLPWPGAHPAILSLTLLYWTVEENKTEKLMGQDRDKGDHFSVSIMGKTDST